MTLEDNFEYSEAFNEMKNPRQISKGDVTAAFMWDEGDYLEICGDKLGLDPRGGYDEDDEQLYELRKYYIRKHKDEFDDPKVREKLVNICENQGDQEIDGFLGSNRLPAIVYEDEFGFIVVFDESRRQEYLNLPDDASVFNESFRRRRR